MNTIKNILVVGVGGQGILTLSDLVALTALYSGYDVKKSEVHGMAQRGGSVNSHVRYGNKIYSPLIEPATADFLVALEKLEALRYINFLNPQTGILLINNERIDPLPVYIGKMKYPPDIIERCRAHARQLFVINGKDEVQALGNPRLISTFMTGALSTLLELEEDLWFKALTSRFPSKFLDINLTAFKRGRELLKQQTTS
ncbi:MAG: indolepyruvate oxidoreductase subunit beta [Candidatus Sumerlaeia bacterium]|nr:indolepyruvate oxidoreductase subunit beta [Candidatus Sumerlaeia bacterium]